jgi:hypothetical protein
MARLRRRERSLEVPNRVRSPILVLDIDTSDEYAYPAHSSSSRGGPLAGCLRAILAWFGSTVSMIS